MENLLDKAINFFSPKWGASREAYRQVLEGLDGLQASYDGAIPTRHDTVWQNISGNPTINNAGLNNNSLKSLRDRSRTLCQNNAIASGMLDRVVTNVCGSSGFILHFNTVDTDWNKQAEKLFKDWFDLADVAGNTWLEFLRLICFHWTRDGDIGIILGADGRLQAIVPELISTPYGKSGDPHFIDGVEVDDAGRPVRYWIAQYGGGRTIKTWTPIAAQDFLFIARKKSFQVRGEPCFATAARVFDQIDQYQKSVLRAANIQSYLALVITSENLAQAMKATPRKKNDKTPVATPPPAGQAPNDPPKPRQQQLEPGSIMRTKPGESVTTITPSQPAAAFPENFTLNIRTLGLELGLPLELSLLDFSKTSYQSARAALLQAYAVFRTNQNIFIARILSRIVRWRVSKFIKDGKLAPNPDSFNHRWIPTPHAMLDPFREIQGIQMGIDAGVETITGALAKIGMEWEDWINIRSREIAEMNAKDIPIYHSAALQELSSDKFETVIPIPTENNEPKEGETDGEIEEGIDD